MSKGKNRLSKEELAIALAYTASKGSESPWTKVGACILRHDNSIAGIGFNGCPPGIEIDWSNRDEARIRTIHSEINALAYIKPGEGKLLACTMMPCPTCLNVIARYGIKKVLYCENYTSSAYGSENDSTNRAKEFGIELKKVPKPQYFG